MLFICDINCNAICRERNQLDKKTWKCKASTRALSSKFNLRRFCLLFTQDLLQKLRERRSNVLLHIFTCLKKMSFGEMCNFEKKSWVVRKQNFACRAMLFKVVSSRGLARLRSW